MKIRFRIRTLAIVISVIAVIATCYNHWRERKPLTFSDAAVKRLLESGRPVIVSAGANWDLNSQLNELALKSPHVLKVMRDGNWVLMNADWFDNYDPEVKRQQTLFGLHTTPAFILFCHDFDRPQVLSGISSVANLVERMTHCPRQRLTSISPRD